MNAEPVARVVVAAVGSEFRQDDGAGPAVLAWVSGALGDAEVLGPLTSPLQLLGAWDGAGLAVIVDAVRDHGGEPGAVRVVELVAVSPADEPGSPLRRSSSHGIGVVDAFRLSCALGTAPARVVLVGVTGECFDDGIGLSPSSSSAVARAAQLVVGLVAAQSTAH
jgi:hydrogenase maturation protease